MGEGRILPRAVAAGAANMALDEALLDAVAAGSSPAVVRLYRWLEPTLSLGYFQRFAEVGADPRWAGVPVVRRPTGGGALWHHLEVTYAVVVPADHPFARPSSTLYRTVHRAIADHLRVDGYDPHRRGPSGPVAEGARPFLCFADPDADDILVGGVKVVGSAQRRRAGAVLQHGSILLARSPATPELPGLRDLAEGSGPNDPDHWGDSLELALAAALELDPVKDEVRPAELNRAATLRREVYEDMHWTSRR